MLLRAEERSAAIYFWIPNYEIASCLAMTAREEGNVNITTLNTSPSGLSLRGRNDRGNLIIFALMIIDCFVPRNDGA
jgi:hypothetical protein